jgi:ATP synthase protein I
MTDEKSRFDELEARLRQAQASRSDHGSRPGPAPQTSMTGQIGSIYRVFVELLAGVLVGGGLGWLLDEQFGTRPWLLLSLLLLGVVAGFWNVIRTARRMAAQADASNARQDKR